VARFYADEGFPKVVTQLLRDRGHDVLTVQEAGQDNQRIPDDQVLQFATDQGRAVLTTNRGDFIRLHLTNPNHAGIVVCKEDVDRARLAAGIHAAILPDGILAGKLIRVNRPNPVK
jgi:predicted nuclease of predicted toxin-antitoxin system